MHNILKPQFICIPMIYVTWNLSFAWTFMLYAFSCYFLHSFSAKSTVNLIFIPWLPVPPRYSEAHWSWVHLLWHLPSAVHDCGEICLNLQGAVLNGSHWSTFAWHCDWQSQSAYHGPGDGQTLNSRWDEVGWVWLIDRLSLSHWGITKPSLHSRIAILCWCMSVY